MFSPGTPLSSSGQQCSPQLSLGILKFQEKQTVGTSLVVQWLRIRLAKQGIPVWSLVQENPTCHRAAKPMGRNYWSPRGCAPQHVFTAWFGSCWDRKSAKISQYKDKTKIHHIVSAPKESPFTKVGAPLLKAVFSASLLFIYQSYLNLLNYLLIPMEYLNSTTWYSKTRHRKQDMALKW